MAVVSFVLCAASLLIVRASVQRDVERRTQDAVGSSVRAFTQFQRQEDAQLLHTAALLAKLPGFPSVFTPRDPRSVQNEAREFWALSGSDMLLLANAHGEVIAAHSNGQELNVASAQQLLKNSLADQEEQIGWWQSGNALYRVCIRAITVTSGNDQHFLGTLVLGKQIDNAVAEQIRHFSGNEITLISGSSVIASTLSPEQQTLLAAKLQNEEFDLHPRRYELGNVPYEAATVILQTSPASPIHCLLLRPLDSSDAFMRSLNLTIVVLGIFIAFVGAAIMMLISRAITRPLELLASAVRAMASGNDTYSLPVQGTSEIAQLSRDFNRMRLQVSESQRKQLEAQRLAALGRAAGSISHDLRHILAALVANAEFLRDADEIGCDRNEVYDELQRASAQMTELIDSLIEVAREGHHLRLAQANVAEIAVRAIALVQSNREYRGRNIEVIVAGDCEGNFDARRLERALFNLLVNSCQATDAVTGNVRVEISSDPSFVELSVMDNGPGLPSAVREKLFQPFVTAEKPNGTGLGLAIAWKIINDHLGDLWLRESSPAGTTFGIRLPRWGSQPAADNEVLSENAEPKPYRAHYDEPKPIS